MTAACAVPDIRDLVPHGAGARLLDRIVALAPGELEAEAVVRPGTLFSEPDGSLIAWHSAELMAQAVSAFSTASRGPGAIPRIGLLLGVRGLRCLLPRFAAGSRLAVRVRESTRDEQGMAVFDCLVTMEGDVVAAGTLTAYEPVDARELLSVVER